MPLLHSMVEIFSVFFKKKSVKPRLARVVPLAYADYFLRHDLLMIFMSMWVIVNWWVWPVPDFHFRKLEAMVCVCRREVSVCQGGESLFPNLLI